MIDSARMRCSRILSVALAAAALIATGGCGGGDDGSAQPGAREAAAAYVDARNAGDFAKVCELLSEPLRRQLGGENCVRFVREQTSGAPRRHLKLVAVRVSGGTARATVQTTGESGAPTQLEAHLELQDGQWRVTGFQ
jgi:hypothetical protein